MTSDELRNITLDTTTWRHYRFEEPYRFEGKQIIRGMRGDFYDKMIDGVVYSYGTFTYQGVPTHRAWGVKSDPLCSFHSIYERGVWGAPQEGCVSLHAVLKARGARVFWKRLRKFTPLIVMFALVAACTILATVLRGHTHGILMDFMAAYFLLFGALKVINLKQFSLSYRAYDDLARRSGAYAYAYPFIEIALGLAFFLGWLIEPASIVTFVLMTQKSLSVFKKLREGSQVTCACLGGFFSIPVTWFTLVEDAVMALMALWMLLR